MEEAGIVPESARGRAFRKGADMSGRGFWRELKRRHVYRVAVTYAVVGWLLIQVVTQVFPIFHLPDWIDQAVVLSILAGFPIALVLAWAFDATPRGIVRTDASPDGEGDVPSPPRPRRAGIAVGLLGASIAVIAGGVYWHFGRVGPHARVRAPAAVTVEPTPAVSGATEAALSTASSGSFVPPIPAKSIAVLPFENLSEDKGNAYFADGMQDLILTKLADIGDLKVISRTSTARYASHPDDLKTIGEQLGVATILEGSVQKAGNEVLITVQLIDTRTDGHIWAQSYQRTLDNIFGVEGEVADKIADSLNAKLTPAETAAVARVGTRNPAALDAYLKAHYFLADSNRTGDAAELARSVPLLEQAIAADPDYADAYALLALAYAKLGGHDLEQETAARRALALDPDNAHAHTEYALALNNKGEFDAAIAEARKAVALPSHDGSDLGGLGFTLTAAGRFDEAARTFARALAADPRDDFARVSLARLKAMLRRYADAREELRLVTARDPANLTATCMLAQIERFGWGDMAAARGILQSAPMSMASSAMLSEAWYEFAFAARDYPAALAVIATAPATMFDKTPRALYEARIYRAQGNVAKAQSSFVDARGQIEARLGATPDDHALHANLARALSGLGDGAAAKKEAERALALVSVKFHVFETPDALVNLASVEARSGRTDDAVETLERLLAMPAGLDLSVEDLRINPDWDPIRNDLRFQALLTKHEDAAPTSSGAAGD
jgi:TolB-like protein/Tfp pilus assembly protein PilF